MPLRTLLFFLFLALSNHSTAEPALSGRLILSHVDHPFVTLTLNPLLQASYLEMGYQLEFIPADGARAITLFQQQLVDGDTGRSSIWLDQHSEALPALKLDQLQFLLYCRQGIPCQQEVLQDPNVHIVIPAQKTTYQFFQIDIRAKPYFVSGFTIAQNMLLSGRADYLLWVEGRLLPSIDQTEISRAESGLQPFDIYHMLQEQHRALLLELEPVLTRKIEALSAVKSEAMIVPEK